MASVKTDRLLRAGICLLAAAFIYVIYSGIHQRVVVAGDRAPEFSLATDTGRAVSLPNFGGKVLLLNFWASWCAPCADETPSLSQLAQQYRDKGLVVLGVSVDQDPQAYRKFVDKYKPAFLTVRERNLHEQFGTFMYPETYLIDSSGKVLQKFDYAGIDWMAPQVTQYISSLL